MDTAVDMAASTNLGILSKGFGARLKGFGVDIEQV